jgi:hypothetical protein
VSVTLAGAAPTRGARGPAPRITPEQLQAAYVVHIREGLSVSEIAERCHAKLGYASADTCRKALRSGWRRLDFEANDHRRAAYARRRNAELVA